MGLFRSFLPLHNPIGFGATDFIELALAALLLLFIWTQRRLTARALRLAAKPASCMLALMILSIALRLALLPQSPAPTPSGADDFAHLLVADTLRHFRLANPPHPMRRFFETVFVVQQPSYSSIFPIGPGLAMAFGWMIFGHPWAGVLLTAAALPALCYWMLRGWTTPGWALVGGLLTIFEFGPLRYWMNTYWGGAVPALGGCLIFGALPRLKQTAHTRDAVWLGLGLGIQLLSRPFEFALLLVPVIGYLLSGWRKLVPRAPAIALALLPAILLTVLQNKQVTGSWTTMPYQLSRYQYGVPATFTFQANATPHQPLSPAQQLDYDAQAATHGPDTDTPRAWLGRLASRIRFYRFFFLPPLYLALPFFLLSLRAPRFLWVALTLLLLAAGTNFYPYFYPHYIAAATCLFVLISVIGLARMPLQAATLIVMLCAAHFLFWYAFHCFASTNAAQAVLQYETWDFVNHDDPQGRMAIHQQLAAAPGSQLVLVRYWTNHRFDEWLQNAADIDHARIVWALDLGAAEDEQLKRYYPHRTAWLLEPDARPPRLSAYPATSAN